MSALITALEELYERLVNFDYYYSMSHDHRVWLAGQIESRAISQAVERLGAPAKKMQAAIFEWHNNGQSEPVPDIKQFLPERSTSK